MTALGNTKDKDFTTTGLKIEGAYENDRNTDGSEVFKAIIREAFGVTDVICGHHLVYETREKRADGFTYEVIQEIPSADALIFDHGVARKIFGPGFKDVLVKLALEPVETRDKLLADIYFGRGCTELEDLPPVLDYSLETVGKWEEIAFA